MNKLRLALEHEADFYWKNAEAFVKRTCLWDSHKMSACSAIAEFQANKDGVTLYESRVGELI